MVCDLAETYSIYDYTRLPPVTVGAFLVGLRDDSRIKMHLSGCRLSLRDVLLARILDELAFQSWAKTKDGQKNRNRPKSVLQSLLNEDNREECSGYVSGTDFDEAWNSIIGAKEDG